VAGVCPVSYAIYWTSLHPGGILGVRTCDSTATGCDPGTLAESAASAVAYGAWPPSQPVQSSTRDDNRGDSMCHWHTNSATQMWY
jgi:hypothetical protein